jgi:hypothetical protein
VRSCFIQCAEAFERNECFKKVELNNIFFRGKEVKFLGVKVIPYYEKKAEENVKTVGSIIYDILLVLVLSKDNFPKDLQHILFII